MPFVSAALLAAERDLLADTTLDAVIPHTDGGTEHFMPSTGVRPACPLSRKPYRLRNGAWMPGFRRRACVF
jgi:hypothetical protein